MKRLERSVDWGTRLDDTRVGYAFVGKGEKVASPVGKITAQGLSHYEKEQFKLAFKLYASFADIKFHQVKDQAAASLEIATFGGDSSTFGAMGPPGWNTSGGHGVFNREGTGWDDDRPGVGALEQGGFGFITIIHELGHGLGLAHPHDRGGSSKIFPGVSSSFGPGRIRSEPGHLHRHVLQ